MQALRNIKYTLRKYFVPMLMSIIGLILAFSAFMLISVQLDFEKGFDRFHPNAGNIYRVDLSDNNTIFRSILPPGFSDEVIRSSSHIVAGTVVCPFLGEVYITTMKDGVSSGFIETANVVSEDFFKVFGINNVSWWIFLIVFLFIQALTAILVVLRYNSIALESPNTSLETE